MNGKIIIN